MQVLKYFIFEDNSNFFLILKINLNYNILKNKINIYKIYFINEKINLYKNYSVKNIL